MANATFTNDKFPNSTKNGVYKIDMTLPNTLIIGFAKCGTTSVFDWLADHPEVCASNEKETYFLCDKTNPLINKNINYYKYGLEGYEKYFRHYDSNKHKIVIEGSPSYVYEQTPIQILSSLQPQPKIIILLRKPSDRVYSSYQFAKNTLGFIDKNIKFDDFIKQCKKYSDIHVLNHKHVNSLAYSAIEGSKYVNYIKNWLDKFDRNNIYVYLSEEFKNPVKLMKQISKDLSIDESFWDTYNFERKMETYQVENQLLHRITLAIYKLYLSLHIPKSFAKLFENFYYNFNTTKLPPKQQEDMEILKQLDMEFAPYNEKLAKLLNIDLSIWK